MCINKWSQRGCIKMVAINGSCKKYEALHGPQILYTRKNKQYCRNKTRHRKKMSTSVIPQGSTPYIRCMNSSSSKLKELAHLFNIHDTEMCCIMMNKWRQITKNLQENK